MHAPMTKILVIGVVAFLTSFAEGQSTSNAALRERDLYNEPSCTCYREMHSFSCHCHGNVYIQVTVRSWLSESWDMIVLLNCSDGTVHNPFRYLSHVNVENITDLFLNVFGCPPPKEGYASLPVRRGGHSLEMGGAAQIAGLTIHCGDLEAFHLERHHFSNLGHLLWLLIDCPALTRLPDDLLFGVSANTIEIKNTGLTSIPSGLFSRSKQLGKLILTGNSVKAFSLMQGLQNLTHLQMPGNIIEDLTADSFENMNRIESMDMSGNLIASLPDCICGLETLMYLTASSNRIQLVRPDCFASLVSLKVLKLDANMLQSLDSLISFGNPRMPYVEGIQSSKANFSFSKLSTEVSRQTSDVTSENIQSPLQRVQQFSNLTLLHFKMNDLSSMHESVFFAFPNLTEVDLSFNRLHFLPPKLFHRNIFLTILRLSNNSLSNISETLLSNNKYLEHLDLSNNQIVTLGEKFFSGVPNLRYLSLANNSIDTLPYDIFLPFTEIYDTETPLTLNLEGNKLTSLPNLKIGRMTELNSARNRLSHIPSDTLHEAYSLQRLNLSFNEINSTEALNLTPRAHRTESLLFHGGLKKIHSVDLSHNRLTTHPVFKLVEGSLQFVNLSGNQIRNAPFQNLNGNTTRIELLDLSSNNLSWILNDYTYNLDPRLSPFIKMDFHQMKKIKHLDLSWNGITITKCIEYHAIRNFANCVSFIDYLLRLEVLLLAHNNIHVIPFYFDRLPKLRHVDLSHNKMKKLSNEHLFFVRGVSKVILKEIGKDENNYVRMGNDFFELPNTHHLTIDVRHNEIAEVELPEEKMQIVRRTCELDQLFSRATVMLGHNPIVCSCEIFNLLLYSQMEIRPVSQGEEWWGQKFVMPVTVDLRDLSCWEPLSMRGENLSDPETWAHHLLPLFGLCQLLGNT